MKTEGILRIFVYAAAAALLWTGVSGHVVESCTGIRLKGADGTTVYARTLEWGAFDLHSRIIIIPRGYEFSGSTPDGKAGVTWKAAYGFAGLDALKKPNATDGINEKGLAVGAFYLPGFAEYQAYDPQEANKSLGPLELVNYILSMFASVEELRDELSQIAVVPVIEPSLGFPPPLHFMATDSGGDSIVIEYVKEGLQIYDSSLGVITNAPPYDWHLTNLRNYVNLSPVALPAGKIADLNFSPLGAGSGMLGLPGDFTPPSRFIRATAFTQTARPTNGGLDTVNEAFRILDNFNIGAGAAEGSEQQTERYSLPGSTQWTSAADTKERVYYFHTMFNRRIRMVDLKRTDFSADDIRYVPIDSERKQDVEDITP